MQLKPDSLPRLSIRSYSRTTRAHQHSYYQLVLPLQGKIFIGYQVSNDQSTEFSVLPGQCLVIEAGLMHAFSADAKARFLVADLAQLPENMKPLSQPYLAISQPMRAFCSFADQQLQHQHSPQLASSIALLFCELLAELPFSHPFDSRVAKVIELLEQDLSQTLPLAQLAEVACLSLSQFKLLFKKQTGKTSGQYLLMLRMEKSKALLAHTDYPINLIAAQVGYHDPSAFSRRFYEYFSQTPKAFACR